MQKEKKGIFSTLLSAFGFSKEEATEALNTLEDSQNMEMKEEEEAVEIKEENSLKNMEEKLKAMEEEKILIEEESTSKDEEIEKLKEELKLMKEELKSMKEEKEEIVSTIENSASYATEAPVSETSIFSKETQKKLNAAFKKAIK
jgi:chromosome segregation ATPase